MSHREELLRVFHIGPEDIAANRAGVLGARQVRKMRHGVWWNVAGAGLIVSALLAVLYFVAHRPLVWFQYVLGGVLAAAGVALGFVAVRRLRAAVRAGVVECFAGPVRLTLRGRTGTWLTVQDRSFPLPIRFWHVGAGRTYRVYVAPAARLIVAMEPDGWG